MEKLSHNNYGLKLSDGCWFDAPCFIHFFSVPKILQAVWWVATGTLLNVAYITGVGTTTIKFPILIPVCYMSHSIIRIYSHNIAMVCLCRYL